MLNNVIHSIVDRFKCFRSSNDVTFMMSKAVIAYYVTQFELNLISLFLKCMISVIHDSQIHDLLNNDLQNFLSLYM